MTGPQFRIQNGRLQLGENRAVTLPEGKWVKFELAAELGKPGETGWTLRVTIPDQPPRVFRNLPYGRPGFKALTWVGFMSLATEKTAFYLDNFDLANRRPGEAK